MELRELIDPMAPILQNHITLHTCPIGTGTTSGTGTGMSYSDSGLTASSESAQLFPSVRSHGDSHRYQKSTLQA